jgi:hypothetical protein
MCELVLLKHLNAYYKVVALQLDMLSQLDSKEFLDGESLSLFNEKSQEYRLLSTQHERWIALIRSQYDFSPKALQCWSAILSMQQDILSFSLRLEPKISSYCNQLQKLIRLAKAQVPRRPTYRYKQINQIIDLNA